MKLSNGKQNELRCIIIEDKTNNIKKYYRNFDDVIEEYKDDNIEIVKIYNATPKIIEKYVKATSLLVKKEVDIVVSMYKMIRYFTDIEMDLDINNKNDKKKFKEIIDAPNALLERVVNEINLLTTEFLISQNEMYINLYDRPEIKLPELDAQNLKKMYDEIRELTKTIQNEDVKNE